MHLIVRDGASLDEIGEPQDLGLAPADFILLSFSDSDLATFRAAAKAPSLGLPGTHPSPLSREGRGERPSQRARPGPPSPLAGEGWGEGVFLRALHQSRRAAPPDLRRSFHRKDRARHEGHPPRLLGGLDYWRYGAEELAHACRKHGVTLAVLPGDGRADPRLPPLSTVGRRQSSMRSTGSLSAGGPQNAARAISALHGASGWNADRSLNPAGGSAAGIRHLPRRRRARAAGSAIVFYRSFLRLAISALSTPCSMV